MKYNHSEFLLEKEKILDEMIGGRCYYPDVRIWMHPFSTLLVYFSKKNNITPNTLSILNLLLSILCLFCFFKSYYFFAFFLFWMRAVLDCSDGALARYNNQTSKLGKFLDSAIDWPFYLILWFFIAFKLSSLFLTIYFLFTVISYVCFVEIYIEPNLSKLVKRAPLKNFFLEKGYILGFGVFTVLEFWSLAFFLFSDFLASKHIYILLILVNIDLLYRIYEIVIYKKR